MKLGFKKNSIVEIIASLFILLFVYTSISKLLDFENFKGVLGQSPFIGKNAAIVAWALPITELLVSGLLFFPRTRLKGLYSSFILMTIFTLYIGYMIAFTPNKPCSCGGVLKQMTWGQHLLFNLAFLMLATLGIWVNRRNLVLRRDANAKPIAYT